MYFDREIDALNKPDRAMPAGKVKPREALAATFWLYGAGLAVSWFAGMGFLLLALTGTVLAVLYSLPPTRLKGTSLGTFAVVIGHHVILPWAGWYLSTRTLLFDLELSPSKQLP